MSKPYQLSAVLYGHSLDVRSVVATPDDSIVSGSRDKTAKYWRRNEFNTGYVESMTYRDQKNFVAAVLYLEPTLEYPDGLIVTGGNDNKILIYKPNEPMATFTIADHTDVVCCLSKAIDKTQFLSGSWDKTAKLWDFSACLSSPVTTFTGHIAALWSVIQISNGNIVTACADKTIGLWTPDGTQIGSLKGHTDCVRAVCDFPEMERFVSVANDALVKVWDYAGENVETLHGHNNYIYCISANRALGMNSFVTGDESYSIKCWKDGINTDTIRLPAQSVWTVTCLSNGDIVSGSSDGMIRIFTQDEGRVAGAEALKQFEEEVNAILKQSTQEIGGYKVSDLPGREALYDPGKEPGQIKMVRENGGVMAYSWVDDGDKSHWEKVGEVMGANEKAKEGKTLHEGVYYDFVFSVDVEDGKPPLKLPYNNGEDVYDAANKFITKNFLPAVYLDQVVEFIRTNSQADPMPNNDYVDPFTGGSRYQPASTSSNTGAAVGMNYDPFTGGSSYTTSGGSTPARNPTSTSTVSSGGYFPHHKYLKFESGDAKVILGKLMEFNEKIGDGSHKVEEARLNSLIQLCNEPCDLPDVEGLFRLLEWPQEILFPVIDVLRLAVRHENNCNAIVLHDGKKLIDLFKTCLSQTTVPNNTLLAFRTLCNLFSHSFGSELIFANQIDLLENVSSLSATNKNIEISMMTFLLNLSILCLKKNDEMGIILLGTILPDALSNCKDPEAHFRGLVALGNLLTSNNAAFVNEVKAKLVLNSTFRARVDAFTRESNNDLEKKRMACAQQLQQLISG